MSYSKGQVTRHYSLFSKEIAVTEMAVRAKHPALTPGTAAAWHAPLQTSCATLSAKYNRHDNQREADHAGPPLQPSSRASLPLPLLQQGHRPFGVAVPPVCCWPPLCGAGQHMHGRQPEAGQLPQNCISPDARLNRKSRPLRCMTPSFSVHFQRFFVRVTFSNCATTTFAYLPPRCTPQLRTH